MAPQIEIGRPGAWHHRTIDPEATTAFAAATNDPDPNCRSGATVPVLYTGALILEALWDARLPDGAIAGGVSSVHAQHELLIHRPIRPGMSIHMRSQIAYVCQVKPGAMFAMRIDVCDDDENLLRQHWWVNIMVGGTLRVDAVGEPVADTTIAPETRARPVGEYRVHVDAQQSVRYAEATGEAPPHSMSDDAAREEGFDRRILQGMCTLGLAISGLVYELDADPTRLRRVAGRFSRPCHNDTDLAVSMFDAGATPDRSTRVAWEATSDGDAVIRHGIVELD